MFNVGPGELMVILILALILLGPEKLPEVAKAVGKGMRELRRATEDLRETVETELYKLESDDTSRAPPPKVVAATGGVSQLPATDVEPAPTEPPKV
ncbi:MAG: Sec-independent protein translocase subunit TatA/TatB [Deltaproteobacteria bacterium]